MQKHKLTHQSAWKRAREDTEHFHKSAWYHWGVEVIGAGALAGLTASLTFESLHRWQVFLITFLVFVFGFFIIYILIYIWKLLDNLFRLPKPQIKPHIEGKGAYLIVKNVGKRLGIFTVRILQLNEMTMGIEKKLSEGYEMKAVELKKDKEAKLLLFQLDGIAFISRLEQVRAELSIFPSNLRDDRKPIPEGLTLDSQIICAIEIAINPSLSQPSLYKFCLQLEGGRDGKDPQWEKFVEVKP